MGYEQRVRYYIHYIKRVLLRNTSALTLYIMLKVHSVKKLHRIVDRAVFIEKLVHVHYIRIAVEARYRFCLVIKFIRAGPEILLVPAATHGYLRRSRVPVNQPVGIILLDRHYPVVPDIICLVGNAEASLSQHFPYAVAAHEDRFDGQRSRLRSVSALFIAAIRTRLVFYGIKTITA